MHLRARKKGRVGYYLTSLRMLVAANLRLATARAPQRRGPLEASTALCVGLGLQIEVLSAWPPVLVARNVTSAADATLLKTLAEPLLERSLVIGGHVRPTRTSSSVSLDWAQPPGEAGAVALLGRMGRRLGELLQCVQNMLGVRLDTLLGTRDLSSLGMELLTVSRYAGGEYYYTHLDDANGETGRKLTVLLHLSSTQGGGETFFPNLLMPEAKGPTAKELEKRWDELMSAGMEFSDLVRTEEGAYLYEVRRGVRERGRRSPAGRKWPRHLSAQRKPYIMRQCQPEPSLCSERVSRELRGWQAQRMFGSANFAGSNVTTAGMEFCCCADVLKIVPQLGSALVFFPGLDRMLMFHGACPVHRSGPEKWIAQQWFYLGERVEL